jgi:hypothetical protein
MRIIQAFTEQHPKPTLRTVFSLMSREVTDEASTRAEEQVGIVIIQTRKGIKCEAIHGHEDGSGEQRTFIETDPMDVVVIGHGLLNYSNKTIHRPLPLYGRNGYRSIPIWNVSRMNPWRQQNKRGINEDYRSRHGTPRKWLQPDARDSITSYILSEQRMSLIEYDDSQHWATLDLMQGHPSKSD